MNAFSFLLSEYLARLLARDLRLAWGGGGGERLVRLLLHSCLQQIWSPLEVFHFIGERVCAYARCTMILVPGINKGLNVIIVCYLMYIIKRSLRFRSYQDLEKNI